MICALFSRHYYNTEKEPVKMGNPVGGVEKAEHKMETTCVISRNCGIMQGNPAKKEGVTDMKAIFRRILALSLVLVLSFGLMLPASAQEETTAVTILFTHDLHSHVLPATDETGVYGGYARLMTEINDQREKYPDAVLLDGGDFSMGSLFQTAYPTSAIELRLMGAMGYDVTTFGNHEFDYLPSGLASMLHAAANCGEPVPQIVEANYLPPQEGEEGYDEDAALVWDALEDYGVKDYTILERGGVYYAVFGITGIDSDSCAPNSGMVLKDAAEIAQKTVDLAVQECKDTYGVDPVVVCLSHSGTKDGKGEDYELAKAVKGIDVIISGHTHTALDAPIQVGDTYIVSAGEYARNLGVLQLERTASGEISLVDYELIPIDDTVAEDEEIAALVEQYKHTVETDYLESYGMSFDEVLTTNPYTFDSVDQVYATQHESTLGNLYADAYKWAVEKTTGNQVDIALTASGVIRETIPVGDVTVSDVFNAASLGVGTEGELVSVYITGEDLKNALEVDASVQPLMHAAQLFMSGIEYSFNTKRMLFNKVDYAMLRRGDGTLEEIQDDKLYSVVTGMYAGQMLGAVESTSFGLISITPRDAQGNPIASDELVNYVVKDENGTPLKEWYAIASYLQSMGGQVDEAYSVTDGRKVVYSSLSPVKLLNNANKFTYILLGVLVVLILLLVLIIRKIYVRVRYGKKKKEKRNKKA